MVDTSVVAPVLLRNAAVWVAALGFAALMPYAVLHAAEEQRPAATAGEPEVAPRELRATRDIAYAPWKKLCFRPSSTDEATMVCRTTTTGSWDTGQTVIRIDVIEKPDNAAARLQVLVPTGLYLPAGVKISIDQTTSLQVPYTICLSNACVAGTLADLNLLRRMELGERLTLVLVDPGMIAISTSLSLNGFAQARVGHPAQVFEQSLDVE